ncbi:unnamed protein product, partial [Ectocarpus sp. 13 AM-2016]
MSSRPQHHNRKREIQQHNTTNLAVKCLPDLRSCVRKGSDEGPGAAWFGVVAITSNPRGQIGDKFRRPLSHTSICKKMPSVFCCRTPRYGMRDRGCPPPTP